MLLETIPASRMRSRAPLIFMRQAWSAPQKIISSRNKERKLLFLNHVARNLGFFNAKRAAKTAATIHLGHFDIGETFYILRRVKGGSFTRACVSNGSLRGRLQFRRGELLRLLRQVLLQWWVNSKMRERVQQFWLYSLSSSKK